MAENLSFYIIEKEKSISWLHNFDQIINIK